MNWIIAYFKYLFRGPMTAHQMILIVKVRMLSRWVINIAMTRYLIGGGKTDLPILITDDYEKAFKNGRIKAAGPEDFMKVREMVQVYIAGKGFAVKAKGIGYVITAEGIDFEQGTARMARP